MTKLHRHEVTMAGCRIDKTKACGTAPGLSWKMARGIAASWSQMMAIIVLTGAILGRLRHIPFISTGARRDTGDT
jgi:hypothetical protein